MRTFAGRMSVDKEFVNITAIENTPEYDRKNIHRHDYYELVWFTDVDSEDTIQIDFGDLHVSHGQDIWLGEVVYPRTISPEPVLIKHDAQGKETVNNLSEFAIKNARTNTAEFRKQLVKEIKEMAK